MSQKGFVNIIIVIVGVIVLAGVAGYFVVNQRTPTPVPSPTPSPNPVPTPTPIPSSTPTPSPSPVPTPTKKPDLRSSLLSIANLHLKDASTIAAGAKLFEIETSLSPEEINTGNIRIRSVFSSFILPNEDAKYVSVEEWFDNSTKRNYGTSSKSFVVRICSGGAQPPPECGEPTGEAEPHTKHLPITGWYADIGAVARSLKTVGVGTVSGAMRVIVTTAGRAKLKYADFFPQSLVLLSDSKAVVVFRDYNTGQYIILDANDGKVLAKGNYSEPPAQ